MSIPALLSTDEAAPILRLDPVTVERYCRKGKIRARKVGRAWRMTEADLLAYLDDCPGGSTSATAVAVPASASAKPARNPRRTYKN